jgi:hypothetical protein
VRHRPSKLTELAPQRGGPGPSLWSTSGVCTNASGPATPGRHVWMWTSPPRWRVSRLDIPPPPWLYRLHNKTKGGLGMKHPILATTGLITILLVSTAVAQNNTRPPADRDTSLFDRNSNATSRNMGDGRVDRWNQDRSGYTAPSEGRYSTGNVNQNRGMNDAMNPK